MNRLTTQLLCLLLLVAIPFASGCSRKPASTADIPRQLPASYQIAVAPFLQPADASQLIAGQIPRAQGKIQEDALEALDASLKSALRQDTSRNYAFIRRPELEKNWSKARSAGQPGALSRWVAYGKTYNLEYILVPQVLDWHERKGSEAGVTDSAHVRVEFYLINVPRSIVAGRSVHEEKQVGLVENLLAVSDFVKRRGQWVTAEQLAVDGIHKAIRELGL